LVLYFAIGTVIGLVAANRAAAHAEPGQDPETVGAEAGASAVETSRPYIIFGVVAIVFLGSRFGYLPGAGRRPVPPTRR
jgi:hypothetical protein